MTGSHGRIARKRVVTVFKREKEHVNMMQLTLVGLSLNRKTATNPDQGVFFENRFRYNIETNHVILVIGKLGQIVHRVAAMESKQEQRRV